MEGVHDWIPIFASSSAIFMKSMSVCGAFVMMESSALVVADGLRDSRVEEKQ